jgi:hypothetical protein|tara:strand:+ start:285 stop:503 length:219 start_codon:yes stop_codon:yes gene_type:complete
MSNPNNDVDVNVLIKLYNQKLATLANQNVLLEAKLQTIMQDHLDEMSNIVAEKNEIEDKYENLMAEIEEEDN